MTEKKIAIVARLRSGKDTVGEYIEKNYGGHLYAFGDILKDEFHEEFPDVPRYPKPRLGYQLFGQLKRYVHGEDYWFDQCFYDIQTGRYAVWGLMETYLDTKPFFPVITDTRQPNEVEGCREGGYVLIRLISSVENIIKRCEEKGDIFKPEDLQHETEKDINNYEVDYEVENNGTLEELYEKVDTIMADLGIEKVRSELG